MPVDDAHHRILAELQLLGDVSIGPALLHEVEHLWGQAIGLGAMAGLAPKGLTPRLGCGDAGPHPFPEQIPFELGQRGHHGRDQLALGRAQFKLEAGLRDQGDISGLKIVEGLDQAIEHIKESRGDYSRLPTDINGATMLALEILYADDLHFLVGQQINPFYQNPLLPVSISIRKNLVEQLARLLRELHKDVTIEYC